MQEMIINYLILILFITCANGYFLMETSITYSNNRYATLNGSCVNNYIVTIVSDSPDAPFDCPNGVTVIIDNNGQSVKSNAYGSQAYCSFDLTATLSINESLIQFNVNGELLIGVINYYCENLPYPIQLLEPPPSFHLTQSGNQMEFYTAVLNLNLTKLIDFFNLVQYAYPIGYNCMIQALTYTKVEVKCKFESTMSSHIPFWVEISDPLGRVTKFDIPSFVVPNNNSFDFTNTAYFDADYNYPLKQYYTFIKAAGYPIALFYQYTDQYDPEEYIVPQIVSGSPNNFTIMFPIQFKNIDQMVNIPTYYLRPTILELITAPYFSTVLGDQLGITSMSITNDDKAWVITGTFTNYDECQVELKYGKISVSSTEPYPYGISSKSGETAQYKFTTMPPQYLQNLYAATQPDLILINTAVSGTTDATVPELQFLNYIAISDYTYLLTVGASDVLGSGIFSIYVNPVTLTAAHLLNGNGTFQDGKFEIYVDTRDPDYIFTLSKSEPVRIIDFAGNEAIYKYTVYGLPVPQPPPYFTFDNYYTQTEVVKVMEISYTVNNIDLSIVGCQNTIFIKMSGTTKDFPVIVVFESLPGLTEKSHRANWNEKFQMHTLDFYIPPMVFTDNYVPIVLYYKNTVHYSSEFTDAWQLKIYSLNADHMPPQIVDMKSSPSVTTAQGGVISWTFKISDPGTGFSNGTIKVASTLDPYVPYVFTISPLTNQDIYEESYTVSLIISPSCASQTYYIYSIELMDNGFHTSTFHYKNRQLPSNAFSPLLNLIGNLTVLDTLSINVNCQIAYTDVTPPTISQFSVNLTNPIDVTSPFDIDRYVTVSFTVADTGSEVMISHSLPYCYLHAGVFDILKFPANAKTEQGVTVDFECYIQIPYGYGAPGDSLLISVFGYTDTNYNVGGMSPIDLRVGFNPVIPIEYFTVETPYIEKVRLDGTSLTIVGRRFSKPSTVLVGTQSYQQSSIGATVIILNNITPIVTATNVTIQSSPSNSNTVVIKPNSGPQPTIIPSPTPSSTNTQCPGTPSCGGSSNGQCINGKCQCVKPWFGLDCLSQNIIVPAPTINTTNPDIDNNFNTTLPDGESITLKSLISIVSLKELKPDGTIVIEHPFTQWVYTNTTSLQSNSNIQEFTYKTNITNNNVLTGVTITLQFFKQPETIIFANEKLEMLASTIKYRMDISKYQFSSALNTLQLVMSVALESESPNESTCSVQESGDIDNENFSEFVKLQVDTHSLYGRFIKRGIIDNRIQQISNTIYTNNSTSINTMSQTYIGINIPNYKSSATLDPDFSVLIDTTPASDKSNSICTKSEDSSSYKSKLSKSQLAGIIIGSIGFASVVVISVIYYIYKTKQSKALVEKMGNKLKNFG
ncbi:EGF-like domain-containing protein [Tieghemostelium lacteum]|uniref:EGF-like domain-containing protein n=1 Tax=Tieghemostelium lacteum TaxID=361077 RepID=A0A151Z7S5_TIELA|nr:EGF-like domain-containing protein [Tieghemostelium lacteum]|eukprot:KYQ90012.1 EGF-like domain-containing protein [Tieghemostelium lacteum]